MNDKELNIKRTMLRAALLNMDNKGELHKVADVTGISGGIEELRSMIKNPDKIGVMDIGIIGMHFGIYI